MESALSNNKTMNNNYKIKETHNVSEASSFEHRKIKSGLMESALSNNKTMNNNRTYILDEPVPDMGVATLSPTPFRRIVRSLRLRLYLFCEGRISVLKRRFKTPIQNAVHGGTVYAYLEKKTIS